MLTRIASSLLLALLANAVPVQGAETADDAAAAQAASAAEEELPSAEIKAAEQRLQRVRELARPVFLDLSISTAPRDWMLASQLWVLLDSSDPGYSGKVRAELLRNAAAAVPDDALVQWVAMSTMPSEGGKGGCSAPAGLPANMDNVLRRESDNGLAWLPLLRKAYQDDDALGVDAALARMAAAERFDDHFSEFAQVLAQFHTEHPQLLQAMNKAAQDADPGISQQTFGGEVSAHTFSVITAKTASPSLHLLQRICGGDPQAAPLEPTRRAICADVAQRLLRLGKSSDLQAAGLRLLHQLGERDMAAEAAAREYKWLISVLFEGPDTGKAINDAAAEWLRIGDELQAMRSVAQAHGLPLTPPPLWQPEQFSAALDDHAMEAGEEATDEAAAAAEAEAAPSVAPAPDERF